MSAGGHEGYSMDDLLAIGTRKRGLDLNISATDVNRSIPYAVSKMIEASMPGLSEGELKDIGERKLALPAFSPTEINTPRIGAPDSLIEQTLNGLQKFLGIRTA